MARTFFGILLLVFSSLTFSLAQGEKPSDAKSWQFAVAGDSRNCGDVVMPAIAALAQNEKAVFYWHLGDLRRMSAPDQDFMQSASLQGKTPTLEEYRSQAWQDFIQSQIAAFGTMPFFLGIGNHETIPPRTEAEFVTTFEKWLNTPEIAQQRHKDDPKDEHVKTYYHWVRDGIDFINLDNAVNSTFESDQLKWVEGVIARDNADATIHTIVVGMHEALPESISAGHSMNESHEGEQSGRQVYRELLQSQNQAHKKIYVLASHSHFFMENIFNTEYWRMHGGILPGWIIGTAGAERYPLPPHASNARAAKTNVYGYLLGTVNPPGDAAGSIRFEFRQIEEEQIPTEVIHRFTGPFVHECFAGNRRSAGIF